MWIPNAEGEAAMSISCAVNVYNDNLALPGLLENASQWADDIVVIHAGPNGKRSTDGTIETLEAWGIHPIMDKIDDGFGVVRTRLIRAAKTDWVFIMDADERFHPLAPAMSCHGEEGYPQFKDPKLTIAVHGIAQQGVLLKDLMTHNGLMIRAARRHWFDFTWKRPCQNWCIEADWQFRILRNSPLIHFDPKEKMHEKIELVSDGGMPAHSTCWFGDPMGLHIDHYHCFFKSKEPEQRKEDLDIYEALATGSTSEMWSKLGYL